MDSIIEQNLNIKHKNIVWIIQSVLICSLFFLCFFEPYLNSVVGSLTKYLLILTIVFVVLANRSIQFKWFHFIYLFWLFYKCLSVCWSSNTFIFNQDLFSQIGMVSLLVVLTSIPLDKKNVGYIVQTIWISSTIIGVLSLFLSAPYHGVANDRNVLVLFGVGVDPNNQAAFLLFGIAISLFYLFSKNKIWVKILCSISLLINLYSIFMTGSRGGLLSAVLLLFCVIFLNKNISIFKKIISGCVIVFFLLLFILVSRFFLSYDTFSRLFSIDLYSGGSNRKDLWENIWNSLISNKVAFFFGTGWGNYYSLNDYFVVTHNTYLCIFSDVGIFGFVLFFAPITYISFILIKKGYILPVLVLLSGLAPSFFLEAISKRYFWYSILFLFICYEYYKRIGKVNNLHEEKYPNY